MDKHTPGPWIVDGIEIIPVSGHPATDGICEMRAGFTDADANLIAAAPDLLAALEAFIAHYDQHQKPMTEDEKVDNDLAWFEAVDDARPVIARARGEAC